MYVCVFHGKLMIEMTIPSSCLYVCVFHGRPMIEMTIPSSLDPTLAPPGHHVVLLFTQYTPYTLADGRQWDEQERNTYADTGTLAHM